VRKKSKNPPKKTGGGDGGGRTETSQKEKQPPIRRKKEHLDLREDPEGLIDDDLAIFQDWMGGNCTEACPAQDDSEGSKKKGAQLDDNIDNLVLASLGILNRMDRIRMALSPGNSTLVQNETSASDLKSKPEVIEDSDPGIVYAISSVSESSSGSLYSYPFQMARDSSSDTDRGSLIDKAHTMETEKAYFHGSRLRKPPPQPERPSTPNTLKAFRSMSWKPDEGEVAEDNSLVASESSEKNAGVSESGSTTSDYYS
jgi:hypothetical protein